MHGRVGIQSAMAIKRQRRIREQAKKRTLERERRLSSSTNSIESMEFHPIRKPKQIPPETTLASGVGMLHLGICFLVLGLFFIGSGLLPDDVFTWRGDGWLNELVITGIFVVALGVFLIIINRVISKKEEEGLEQYVQRQLTRSRSGHRLERDVETGGLTTKHHRRMLEKQREDKRGEIDTELVPIHSPKIISKENGFTYENGEIILEKIDEEDSQSGERIDMINNKKANKEIFSKEIISSSTSASLSQGSPSEYKDSITNGRSYSTNV